MRIDPAVLRMASFCAVILALFAVASQDAAACATCVSVTECNYERCEGSDSCSFDGPPIEVEIEGNCNVLTKIFFGCSARAVFRQPTCRASGGPCRSTLPECNPRPDLDPDIVDPQSPIGDDDDDDEGQSAR